MKWETWNLAPKLTWVNSRDWVLVSWTSVDHWDMRSINRLEDQHLSTVFLNNYFLVDVSSCLLSNCVLLWRAYLFFYMSIFTQLETDISYIIFVHVYVWQWRNANANFRTTRSRNCDNKMSFEQRNKWKIIYLNCGERYEDVIDHWG